MTDHDAELTEIEALKLEALKAQLDAARVRAAMVEQQLGVLATEITTRYAEGGKFVVTGIEGSVIKRKLATKKR